MSATARISLLARSDAPSVLKGALTDKFGKPAYKDMSNAKISAFFLTWGESEGKSLSLLSYSELSGRLSDQTSYTVTLSDQQLIVQAREATNKAAATKVKGDL